MKNKKLCAAIFTVLLSTSISACNFVQEGPIDKIAGTYEMIKWECTHYYDGDSFNTVSEEERQTINILEENGIKNYIVVTESGNGYYVYQDNETISYAIETKQVYVTDSEDETLIEEIKILDANLTEWTLYVQSKKHTFTSNKSAWRTSFHIGKNEYTIGNKDKITMKWKRVSKRQDLKYVERKMNIENYVSYVDPLK